MVEVLGLTFVQNALVAAVLVSIAAGVIGSLVVVHRLVFMAGGMAHAAYGGVGLALFAGWPVMPVVLGFTTGAALVMGVVTRRARERSDMVIGALWAGGMSFGIILLDLTPGYNVDLLSYLFGSILTVSAGTLWLTAGLLAAVLVAVVALYKPLLMIAHDPDYARTRGVPVDGLHFLLLVMIAASVVMVIQVVGLILVIALLTIPPFLARRRAPSLGRMMAVATGWSLLFCLSGLVLAYILDLTSGATIIAVAAITFFGVIGLDALGARLRRH